MTEAEWNVLILVVVIQLLDSTNLGLVDIWAFYLLIRDRTTRTLPK